MSRIALLLGLYGGPALIAAVLWALNAWAEMGAGTVGASPEGTLVTVTRETCRELVPYVPAPDVAYTPGVDAAGRPVTPADLPGVNPIGVPQEVTIRLRVLLQDRLGIPADPSQYRGDVELGYLTVRDRRVYLNGQPITDESQAALETVCQKIMQ